MGRHHNGCRKPRHSDSCFQTPDLVQRTPSPRKCMPEALSDATPLGEPVVSISVTMRP